MIKHESSTLIRHIESAPPGSIFTNKWLDKQGISAKLAWWYVRIGLLERLGTKAYIKAGDDVTWVSAVAAMQNQLNLPVHVGSYTALRLFNRVKSYFALNSRKIILFIDLGTRMPSWLSENDWDVDFEIHRTSLFCKNNGLLGVVDKQMNGLSIQLSCPERAAMEMLFLAPKYETLYNVTELMEQLGRLQSETVQLLLENCNSIKVKRFFLYFAKRFRCGLVPQLDLAQINLGSGKRVIGRGGRYRYHPEYMLSLPEKIDEPD